MRQESLPTAPDDKEFIKTQLFKEKIVNFTKLLSSRQEEPTTIIITTHYIEEARGADRWIKTTVGNSSFLLCWSCKRSFFWSFNWSPKEHWESYTFQTISSIFCYRVGFMRHGHLLAEDSPDLLLKSHSAFSLEQVFLNLCQVELDLLVRVHCCFIYKHRPKTSILLWR